MDTEEILEPEPLSKDDQLWANNTEYQVINYIINYIDNCDLLMLDYAKHELESYSPHATLTICSIIKMVSIKIECILSNKPVSLMHELFSYHSQHNHSRYINYRSQFDYSSKEIQEFIKFIDYNKENKSNFDFVRFHLLNRNAIARIEYQRNEYEKNRRNTIAGLNREEMERRKEIEIESGKKLMEKYGKKSTCHIS
jgi:hypothetical protein